MLQRLQQLLNQWGLALPVALIIGLGAIGYFAIISKTPPTVDPTPVTTTPTQPAPISAAIMQQALNPKNDKATVVLELFNPSDQSLTHQLNETTVRQQVEQIMATSYVLFNCGLTKPLDYRDSFRAAIVFAHRNKLGKSMEETEVKVRQIAEAAGASYSLLYSRTKCNDPQLPTTAKQLLNWQKAYLN
ncbi:MAG: hypothetical protein ACOYNL_08265 [Rickettsiales bacterium]